MAHILGWERFRWPVAEWRYYLVANGIVEYLFDASCAVAIYMTSPVVVAVVSPLTIPLSMLLVDQPISESPLTRANPSSESTKLILLSWAGVVVIMIGIYIMETKPRGLVFWMHHIERSKHSLD